MDQRNRTENKPTLTQSIDFQYKLNSVEKGLPFQQMVMKQSDAGTMPCAMHKSIVIDYPSTC